MYTQNRTTHVYCSVLTMFHSVGNPDSVWNSLNTFLSKLEHGQYIAIHMNCSILCVQFLTRIDDTLVHSQKGVVALFESSSFFRLPILTVLRAGQLKINERIHMKLKLDYVLLYNPKFHLKNPVQEIELNLCRHTNSLDTVPAVHDSPLTKRF